MTLLIGGVIFTGQKLLADSETESTDQEYIISTVEKGTIANSVTASGEIETANYLSVTTSVNGIVKEVFVSEGDAVKEGDPIMEITLNSDGEESLSSAWAAYLSAKNALDSSYSALYGLDSTLLNAEEAFDNEKVENSYQTHDERIAYSLAENSYLSAKANYDNQVASIEQKKVAVNKAWLSYQAQSPTILATDSGTIANIVFVEGMDISNSLSTTDRSTTTVAAIKKEGTPIAALNVSELDINDVSVGQKARIELSSVDDKTFSGKVVGINKIGEASSGVTYYTVIVKFDEATDLALPAMGVEAEIIVEERTDVVYIPTAAITTQRGTSYVTKIEGGNESQAEVKLGISDGTNTEIISGLSEGDEILVEAFSTSGFTEAQNNSGGIGIPGMGPGMGGGR